MQRPLEYSFLETWVHDPTVIQPKFSSGTHQLVNTHDTFCVRACGPGATAWVGMHTGAVSPSHSPRSDSEVSTHRAFMALMLSCTSAHTCSLHACFKVSLCLHITLFSLVCCCARRSDPNDTQGFAGADAPAPKLDAEAAGLPVQVCGAVVAANAAFTRFGTGLGRHTESCRSQKGLGWEAKHVLEYCICSIMSPCMHCKAGIVGSNVLSSPLCRMWVESWWCVSLCWCVLLCVLIRSVC